MPTISRSTPASNGGRSSITSSTGTSLVRRTRSTMRTSAAATSSRSPGLRPQRGDRAPRLDEMRAREIDGRLEAARQRRRHVRTAGPLRGLQLHEDRAEPLRQRVVDVAGNAIALFEHRLTTRLEQAAIDETAVVEREGGLPGGGVDQRPPPAPLALGILDAGQGDPSERLRRQVQRRDEQRLHGRGPVEFAHRLGQPLIVSVGTRRFPCGPLRTR